MDLGHQFKLMLIRSDVFTSSGFTIEQSYEWLSGELKAYQKPCVVAVSSSDLKSLAQMIALLDRFPIEPVELAVIGAQSVTFRTEPPVTLTADIWKAIGQRFGLSHTDSINVCNWNGLRISKVKSLGYFQEHGWIQPNTFTTKLGSLITNTDLQSPH